MHSMPEEMLIEVNVYTRIVVSLSNVFLALTFTNVFIISIETFIFMLTFVFMFVYSVYFVFIFFILHAILL